MWVTTVFFQNLVFQTNACALCFFLIVL